MPKGGRLSFLRKCDLADLQLKDKIGLATNTVVDEMSEGSFFAVFHWLPTEPFVTITREWELPSCGTSAMSNETLYLMERQGKTKLLPCNTSSYLFVGCHVLF